MPLAIMDIQGFPDLVILNQDPDTLANQVTSSMSSSGPGAPNDNQSVPAPPTNSTEDADWSYVDV